MKAGQEARSGQAMGSDPTGQTELGAIQLFMSFIHSLVHGPSIMSETLCSVLKKPRQIISVFVLKREIQYPRPVDKLEKKKTRGEREKPGQGNSGATDIAGITKQET